MKRALVTVAAVACLAVFAEAAAERPAQAEQKKPTPEEVIEKRLNEVTVNFELQDAPLPKVLNTLARLGQVSILLDSRAKSGGKPVREAKVTLDVLNLPLREVLQQVARPLGLKVVIADAFVLVTDAGEVETVMDPGVPEEVVRKLAGTLVNLDVFDEDRLLDMINAVVRLAGYETRMDRGKIPIPPEVKVTFACWDTPALTVVNWMCRLGRLRWRFEDGRVVVEPAKTAEESKGGKP